MDTQQSIYDNEILTSKYRHAYFEVITSISSGKIAHQKRLMTTISQLMSYGWTIVHISDISSNSCHSVVHAYKPREEEKPNTKEGPTQF